MKLKDLNYTPNFNLVESRRYLYEGLDDTSRNSVMLWESAGNSLVEFALTADQINQIFAQAEQGMTGQGANRTMIGKAKDAGAMGVEAAQKVNAAWENLKTQMQNSKPVQNFDQKVSDLLSKIGAGAKDPQFQGLTSNWVQKYRNFAQQHPIAQGAIYATLVALAGLSGAGVAGAASLGLLKMADKLLQGERFSSAAGAGLKTGAIAGAAGAIGNAVHGHNAAAAAGQGLPAHPSAASDYGAGTYDATSVTPSATDAHGAVSAQDSLTPGEQLVQPGTGADTAATTGAAATPDANNASMWDDGTAATGTDLNSYTVMPGETMSSIAKSHGVSVADLKGLNPDITNPDVLKAGQTINIPPANGSDVYAGGTGTYSDTANNIARGNYTDSPISHRNDVPQAATQAPQQAAPAATQATQQAAPAATQATPAAPAATVAEPTDADKFTPRIPPGASASDFSNLAPNKVAEPAGFVPTGNAYIDHLNRAAANGIRLRESYIDTRQTARTWMLRESLGKARGGVVLTEAGVNAIFEGVMDWLKQKGKNLTTTVTADKLKQAWIKDKMPNDSEAIAGILQKAGVGKAVIDDIYNSMSIPTSAQTGAQQKQQGLLGRAAQAVGGVIGGTKGAIAGTKDAYLGGKSTGFDAGRAGQAGDFTGATGQSNPYPMATNRGAQQTQAQQGGGAQQANSPAGATGADQDQATGQAAAAGGQSLPATSPNFVNPAIQKQGMWDKFKGARTASKAGKEADAARTDAIANQVTQWQLTAQGIDPSDTSGYQQTFQQWASTRFKSANPQVVAQAASSINPKSGASITKAVGDVYNDAMRNRQMGTTGGAQSTSAQSAGGDLWGNNAGAGQSTASKVDLGQAQSSTPMATPSYMQAQPTKTPAKAPAKKPAKGAVTHTMYDKGGNAYQYTKGKDGQWKDAQGGAVNPEFAATIDAQYAQNQKASATGAASNAAQANISATAAGKRAAGATAAQSAMKPTTAKATAKTRDPNEPNRFLNKIPGEYTAHGAGTTPPNYKKGIQAFPADAGATQAPSMAEPNAAQPVEPTMEPTTAKATTKKGGKGAMANMAAGLTQMGNKPNDAMSQAAQQLQQPQTASGWTGRTGETEPAQTQAQTQAQAQAEPNLWKGRKQQTTQVSENINFSAILWRRMREGK